MGGKSRKGGGVSKRLISMIKNGSIREKINKTTIDEAKTNNSGLFEDS